MTLSNYFNLKIEKSHLKAFFAIFILFLLPAVFRILDHNFQKYFGLNKYVNVFDFIFIGTAAFFFIRKDQLKKYVSLNTSLIVLFICLSRMSIFFSDGEIHHKAFYDLFRASLAMFLIFVFLTTYFRRNYEFVFKCFFMLFFIFAFFESIVGILQFILQRPLGLSFLNEPFFSINNSHSAKIYISENSLGIFSNIIHSKNGDYLRSHGTFLHPNVFAGFLNISLILTMYQIHKSKKKIVFSIFLILQLVALILTFSRAGMLAFVCSSFMFFILMKIKKNDVKKMGLIFLTCSFVILCVFSKFILERGLLGSLFQSNKAKELNCKSDNLRSSLSQVAKKMIKKNPVLGVGFRNFLIKKDEYSNQKLERAYVHNIYLLIASESGFLALMIFLLLLTSIIFNAVKYCINDLFIISICIIFSFLIIGFFDHYPISSYFGKIVLFSNIAALNFLTEISKPLSYSQKACLYQ
ncbi:MAG: O-antigen ligase family protein [Parachlamydiales bacterium]|jgi:O-antigen ligase